MATLDADDRWWIQTHVRDLLIIEIHKARDAVIAAVIANSPGAVAAQAPALDPSRYVPPVDA